MATTFISYNVWYNGTQTASGVQAAPLNVVYNNTTISSISSNSTATIPTASKYCAANVVIGAKTFPTGSKYCESNIIVNANTVYYWNKYTIGTGWSSAYTAPYMSKKSFINLYPYFGGANVFLITNGVYYMGANSFENSVHWNASSQKYDILINAQGVQTYHTSLSSFYNAYRDGYLMVGGLTTSELPEYRNCNYWATATLAIATYNRGSSYGVKIGQSYNLMMEGASNTIRMFYRTSYQAKGDFIEQVSSTTAGTYPSNGISGSYWYTEV